VRIGRDPGFTVESAQGHPSILTCKVPMSPGADPGTLTLARSLRLPGKAWRGPLKTPI